MNRSRWSLVPAVVLGAGLFAACGSSSYSGSTATTKAAAAVTTPETAATTKAATATTKAAAAATTAAAAATAAAGTAAAGGGASSIDVKSFAFSPSKLSVAAGTDIAVKNEDSFEHTITSDDGKSFDVDLPGSKSATVKGLAAGTYKYHCAIHPSMTGTLTVA